MNARHPSTHATSTSSQLAEDFSYTLNHSVYCMMTDFLNPILGAAVDHKIINWLFPGCGQNHIHSDACQHPVPPLSATKWEKVKAATKQTFSGETLKHYFQGEFLGDFGAIPLTLGVQYLFPDFMRGLEKLAEPIARPIVQNSAERAAKSFAKKQGIAEGSEAYEAHKRDVYAYEMHHLPQAMMWTASSFGITTAYVTAADKTPMPLEKKLLIKGASVLFPAVMTSVGVLVARTIAPNKMEAIDGWTNDTMEKYVVQPLHRMTHAVLGGGGNEGKSAPTPQIDASTATHSAWQTRGESQVRVSEAATAQPVR
jgi:hypothetical protein